MKDFYALFVQELKNIYSVEKQLIEALPKMATAAKSSKLKEAIRHHLQETKNQLERLEEIGLEINEDLRGYECVPLASMIKEAQKIIRSSFEPSVKDAALISGAQRVEHYEIACYGFLKSCAKHFKLEHVEKLLDESSKEEGNADKKLNEIADGTVFTSGVNDEAFKKCA